MFKDALLAFTATGICFFAHCSIRFDIDMIYIFIYTRHLYTCECTEYILSCRCSEYNGNFDKAGGVALLKEVLKCLQCRHCRGIVDLQNLDSEPTTEDILEADVGIAARKKRRVGLEPAGERLGSITAAAMTAGV